MTADETNAPLQTSHDEPTDTYCSYGGRDDIDRTCARIANGIAKSDTLADAGANAFADPRAKCSAQLYSSTDGWDDQPRHLRYEPEARAGLASRSKGRQLHRR